MLPTQSAAVSVDTVTAWAPGRVSVGRKYVSEGEVGAYISLQDLVFARSYLAAINEQRSSLRSD